MTAIETIPRFKQFILDAAPYKGGSTREETSGFENDGLLREAIAIHNGLPAEQIITGNSGMELIDLVCRGLVDEQSEVILCSPTFMAYKNFANLSGGRVIDVPLQSPDFTLDMNTLISTITDNTRLLFISNPNNPTGSLIKKKKMDTLMHLLPEHVTLVYDEVYHHYADYPAYPRAVDYIRKGKNVIGLHSFSKAFGLAGIRLGYAFSTQEISNYPLHLRRPFMINTLTTVAGVAALQDKEHITKTQQLVKEEKHWLYEQMALLDLEYWPSQSNFILFKSPVQPTVFVQSMLEEGVMIRSAEVMKAKGCVRVTVGAHEANEAFIAAAKKCLQKYSSGNRLALLLNGSFVVQAANKRFT